MSKLSVRVLPETLRSLAYTSISDSAYTRVGSSFLNPSRQMHFANSTDVTLIVSIDGINAHDVVTPFTNYVIDWNTNRSDTSGSNEIGQGTQWYVKSRDSNPSQGYLDIATYYGSNF